MRIFDFLKKRKKEKTVSKKMAFSEIKNWIEKKGKETEIKEREILDVIEDRIKNLKTNLKTKIIALNEFDIESKKEDGRIKRVVSNSRTQYIETLNNFISNLENLEETKLSGFITKIDKIFSDFNRLSFKNYERATILIGKEMADIKEETQSFSKDLVKIFNNNKKISELAQKIELIKSKLNLLNSIENNITGIKKTIISFNEKILQKEKENKKYLDEIEKIKQSENYKNMLKKKEKLNILKRESKNAIFTLKQLIDFKTLTNFFHTNERQMNIIKDYKKDFYTNFKQDNGERIMDLLNESKLNTNVILEKINSIKVKIKEIAKHGEEIKEDKVKELYHKTEKCIMEINDLKIEKIKTEKRNKKTKERMNELINSLKQEFNKINIEIV